ncbi:MAG TPA: acyl-CoA dehydrogenase family protein [Actinomycetota bacterium]|nr:acyl-CoA dehydrogenase family protein [Actinomycetota bacterium]
MDLTWTDEQNALREAVRDLCAKHATPEIVRALEADAAGYRPETWTELARMELLGLTIPEEHGGVGQTILESVVVCEELGRSVLPSPYFVSSVLGAALIRLAGSDEQRSAWLPKLASGNAVVTVAWQEPDRSASPEGVAVRFEGGKLSGEKIMVPFAASANGLVVLARSGGDLGLFLADPAGEGVTVRKTETLGSGPDFMVTFEGATASPLGSGSDGWAAFEEAMVDGMIALAAMANGGSERAHEMAVEYAKERVQFGKPIGSFQAIAHPLAETYTEIGGAKALAYEAAWARAAGKDARTLAAMAKLYACDVYRRTTKLGQQVYGGIGFTTDIDMQLYFRRAKQLELSWFGPRELEEIVAAAELDAPEPFVSVDGLT